MKINPKTRFSKTAQVYDRYRPTYPEQLVDWIINTTQVKPPNLVVDIGCGTGIASRLFAKRGFKVIGIDSNQEMLEQAIKKGGGPKYQKGYSDQTGLPEAGADLCISAQAFHWFDIEKTNQELKRILKPDGFCCAFWNVRIKTPFVGEYESLLKVYSSDYEKTPKAKETIEAIKQDPSIKSFKEKQFDNTQSFKKDDLIGRAYSTSYVAHGVKDHNKFKQALRDLFDKYQLGGNVSFKYKTIVICWQSS